MTYQSNSSKRSAVEFDGGLKVEGEAGMGGGGIEKEPGTVGT